MDRTHRSAIHSPGDLVTINAGSQNGIQVGQEFYTRRILVSKSEAVTPRTPGTMITTSWIRVYAVDDTLSLATITHACETVDIGDHLEPFKLPTMPTIVANKTKPQRDNYAHVMLGHSRRSNFGKGDFFLMDRGSDHGVEPGTQFVLYRNKEQPQNFLYDLGEAVAVDVTPETATLLVTVSRDAIAEGDLVAIRGMWKATEADQKDAKSRTQPHPLHRQDRRPTRPAAAHRRRVPIRAAAVRAASLAVDAFPKQRDTATASGGRGRRMAPMTAGGRASPRFDRLRSSS